MVLEPFKDSQALTFFTRVTKYCVCIVCCLQEIVAGKEREDHLRREAEDAKVSCRHVP